MLGDMRTEGLGMTDDDRGDSFAERLDHLLRTARDPSTGKAYSVRQVAAELTRRGCRISHTHLNNLRLGRAPDPRRSVIEAIADFFGRPVGFFIEPSSGSAAEVRDQRRLADLLADPAIQCVATRLAEARLSPEGTRAVIAMIEQVQQLEAAAQQRAGRAGPRGRDRRPA